MESTLVCTPMAAAGRWLGVILSDRKPDRPPLSDSERYLLWTLGKTAALATLARVATTAGARARQLQERMDLAREVHESVIQRPFGIQLVFSSQAELSPRARERIGAELQAALFDLRRALQRPLARQAPETSTTLLQEVDRLRKEHRDLHLTLREGSEQVQIPRELEPLAQSVLAEAVRNAHKHAGPTKVEVSLAIQDDDTLVLDVSNDGVRGKARQHGMGLKLAALEALQLGGIVEFGERESGTWRVRLAVPLDRT
jgi:signal transduction histidine kinase